jgi:hypothetical protein
MSLTPWKNRAGFPNVKRRKVDRLLDERMTARRSVKAISIGPTALKILKEGAVGEVHSVFERAFNILFEGELVGVAREDVPKGPFNIIINISNTSMKSLVHKGARVSVDGGLLLVGDELTISLKGAEIWKPRQGVTKALDVESVRRNLSLVKELAGGREEGLGQLMPHAESIISGAPFDDSKLNQVSRVALLHITALASAVKSGDLERVRQSSKNLIGLGLGLSPSADDMLAGFMAGLRWAINSFKGDVNRVDEINRAIVARVAENTTLLSQQLLKHGARGDVNEAVKDLLEAILAGEVDVKTAAEKVLAMGETSGVDTTVGILLGLSIGMDLANV